MSRVTLINPFEVEASRELEFLGYWQQAMNFLKRRPGFLESELVRARDPHARFRFTSLQTWNSADDFHRAIQHPDFVTILDRMPFPHYATLYEPFLKAHPDPGPLRPPVSDQAASASAHPPA